MKKILAATMVAGLLTVAGGSVASAATTSANSNSDLPLTGAPAYQRCIAAGGTAHFCGDLGGYWYFQ